MIQTPESIRLHIVLLGERNSGKSSLLNAIAGQQVSIVSDIPGTTTDHVSKAMELPGLGACVLLDTAGLDDVGDLGKKRIESSVQAFHRADLAIVVVDAATGIIPQLPDQKDIVLIPVINKSELASSEEIKALSAAIADRYHKTPVIASALRNEGIQEIVRALQESVPEDWNAALLTEGLVAEGDLVVLVMPQDRQAPKGRLILPQQHTIRELLDRKCRVVCCTTDCFAQTLSDLKDNPAAVITDSQDFAVVAGLVPENVKLTSFSILFAAAKGDIEYFKISARKIDSLTEDSKVLIAEACTHVPATEDIGRVKIPNLLRRRAGQGLVVDVVSGRDFPEDLSGYDLVIHCGACMFNRRYVMSRVAQAKNQGVPMTNYGVAIAYINNLI